MVFDFTLYCVIVFDLVYSAVLLVVLVKPLLGLLVEFTIGGNAHCIIFVAALCNSTLGDNGNDLLSSLFDIELFVDVFLLNLLSLLLILLLA